MPRNAPFWWYDRTIPVPAWGLWPVSKLYALTVQTRFLLTSPHRSRLPVICVGNFTMGGAGKTPTALKLLDCLRLRGWSPAFLTRGYGGSEAGPRLVRDEDTANTVGDEPLLLAQSAPTVISRHRPSGAELIESLGCDLIVMDDGFQNPSLHKDFSLLVVDGGVGVGCGQIFPLGPLRAPFQFQASRADAVIQIRNNEENAPFPAISAPIFAAKIVSVLDHLPTTRFVAFCGIGRPAKFFTTLRESGLEIASTRSFPDHHPYTETDATMLLDEANRLKASLITTEKDRARLRGTPHGTLLQTLATQAFALPIRLEFAPSDSDALLAMIHEKLAKRYHRPQGSMTYAV